ncbi:toll-like receptor 7 [Pelobates fuscus]|uniref:toll-like receptor 7 n=1 Tax=Pelobates fuscus TaxID=191477 RepID=UPI002FE4D2B9
MHCKIYSLTISRILFLFSIFLFSKCLTAMWFPKSLPCDVINDEESATVIVDCSDRRLIKIPPEIPSNVTNLTLTINHIPEILPESFAHLKDLVELDFRCNCVPIMLGPKDRVCTNRLFIKDGSFSSMNNLRSLYLDGNQLLKIPKGLPANLVLLSLEANTIFSLYKKNFTGISNIEMLYLGQNCYYRNPCNVSFHIEKDAFEDLLNLTILSIKSNNLSYVPEALSSTLRELYLYNNRIEYIHEYDLKNMYNLEILDLSGNCPRCYNSPFPCIPCENGAPINIHPNAFATLRNLRILRLHSNSLRNVPIAWFKNTRNLQILDLSQNFLASEIRCAGFLTLLPKLKELDFSFNFELQVYSKDLQLSKTFSSLLSLETLRIRGYVFQELNKNNLSPLFKLKNLTVLDLGTNFIKIVDFTSFQKIPSLQTVVLSNNKISPSGGSSLASCSAFSTYPEQYNVRGFHDIHYFLYDENARHCKSKVKEDSRFQLFVNEDCKAYGMALDLSQNNFFFIRPTDFNDLGYLKCLNLSGNAISQTLNGTEFSTLRKLKYLDFSNNRVDLLYQNAFQELTELEVLDLSYNKHYFLAEGITHMLNFTANLKSLNKLIMNWNEISTSTNIEMVSQSLHTLEFKGNNLNVLWREGDKRYLHFFKKLSELSVLDISYNSLPFIPNGVFEGMPPKLTELNLAKNNLKTFEWVNLHFLQKLEVLDLSYNYLTTVPQELSNCTCSIIRLILSNNKIKTLTPHFLRNAFTLKLLDLSDNKIQYIGQTSFPENVLDNLNLLKLQGNPFKCTCDAVWFVSWINRTKVSIPNLVTDVICAGPGAHRGKSLVLLDLFTCQQNNYNIILYSFFTSFIICLTMICISSHLFFWDFWYIYQLFKAKVNDYKRLPKFCYDAFIVYDTTDSAVSDWVYNEFVNVIEEQGDKKYNLCLEGRDWLPGLPFVHNLQESVQHSRKTVFVLTKKYVKSGHFKTTFYIAHQRLIDERTDVIILIFLEEILERSRYLNLRKSLCRNSVLYWPSNPKSQKYFWHCLKTALASDNQMAYDKLFKEKRWEP